MEFGLEGAAVLPRGLESGRGGRQPGCGWDVLVPEAGKPGGERCGASSEGRVDSLVYGRSQIRPATVRRTCAHAEGHTLEKVARPGEERLLPGFVIVGRGVWVRPRHGLRGGTQEVGDAPGLLEPSAPPLLPAPIWR